MQEPKFNKYVRVVIKDNGKSGYIDAIVNDRYLIRLDDSTFTWIDEWDIILESKTNVVHKFKLKDKNSISDAVKRLLGL